MRATVCAACGCYPCQCGRTVERRPLTARPLREPCVCNGPEIVAASRLEADIMAAVQRHQVEPAHIAHDEAHGIPLGQEQRRAQELDGLARELVGMA